MAQDSLLLMSGRKVYARINLVEPDAIHFSFEDKKGRTQDGIFMNDEVFSYTKFNEKEKIVYEQDKINGLIYTPEEHRYYIFGQQDARTGYSAKWTAIGGFATGFGTAVVLDGGALPFLYPLAYAGGMQIPIIKIKAKSISNPDFKMHDPYRRGYEKTSRSKKFVTAFLSSISGVLAGTVFNELIN